MPGVLAVWQRLPDIAPNDRRSRRKKKSLGVGALLLPSRESAVVERDNVCEAHLLTHRLSTLDSQQSRTIRLLDTGRQSFIARQAVKRLNLERAGITDGQLLRRSTAGTPPQTGRSLTVAKAHPLHAGRRDTKTTAESDTAREEDRKSLSVRKRPIRNGVQLKLDDDDDDSAFLSSTTRLDVDCQSGGRGRRLPRYVNSAAPGVVVTDPAGNSSNADRQTDAAVSMCRRSKTMPAAAVSSAINSDTTFMTHNFSRYRFLGAIGNPNDADGNVSDNESLTSSLSSSDAAPKRRPPPVAGVSPGPHVIADRRFLSLIDVLSPCSASVRPTPRRVEALGVYSDSRVDSEAPRRTVDVIGGTSARPRYAQKNWPSRA